MKILFFLFGIVVFNLSFSQTDSLHVSRFLPEKFSVYPFKAMCDENRDLIEKELVNYKFIQNEVGKIVLNSRFTSNGVKSNPDKINSFGLGIASENLLKENVPPLIDSLPDGFVVQYYQPIGYADGDTIKFDTTRIAFIYQIRNNVSDGMSYWFTPDEQLLYKQGEYCDANRINNWWATERWVENNISCKYIIQTNCLKDKYGDDNIEISYDKVFPTGKHQIIYQRFGYRKYYIYFDSILLLSSTDSAFTIYDWKISPESPLFKATSENRYLIESGVISNIPISIESNTTFLKHFPNDWKEGFVDSYTLSLLNHFSLNDLGSSYFTNIQKIDPITGQEVIYSDIRQFNFSEYNSYYANGNPFIQLTTKNGRKQWYVFDENGKVMFSKLQLDTNEVHQILKDKANSFISKNHLFFVEQNFEFILNSLKSATLYSYHIDSTFMEDMDDNSKSWYDLDVKTTNYIDVSEILDYTDSLLIDNNLYHPYIFSKNNQYYFQSSSKRNMIDNNLHLVYSCYDTIKKKITKQVKINFIAKELEAQLFDYKACESTLKLKKLGEKQLCFIEIKNKQGLQIKIDSVVGDFSFFKKLLENSSLDDSTFQENLNILINYIFKGDFINTQSNDLKSSLIELNQNFYKKYTSFKLYINDKPINGVLKLDGNQKDNPIYVFCDSIFPINFIDIYELLYEVNGIRYHNLISPVLKSYFKFDQSSDFNPSHSEIAIINGKFNGEFSIFNKNKLLLQKINLIDNLVEGQITKYDFQSKKYYKELNFVHGKLEGRVKSGRYITYYKDGVKEGLETFQRTGKYIDSTYYKNGLKNGRSVYYEVSYPYKKIHKTILYYKNDILDGKLIRLEISNKVDTLEISHFKNGKYDGFRVWYDNNLNTYDECEYKSDVLNGSFFRYLKKGNSCIFKGSYNSNELDGQAIYYYPNGKVFSKVKYLKGNMIDTAFIYDSLSKLKVKYILLNGRLYEEQRFKNGKLYSMLTMDTLHLQHQNNTSVKLPFFEEFLIFNSYKYKSVDNSLVFFDLWYFKMRYNHPYYNNELQMNYICYDPQSLIIGEGRYAYVNGIQYENDEYNMQKIGVWKYKSKDKGQFPYQIEYEPKNLIFTNNAADTVRFYPSQKITTYNDSIFNEISTVKYVIENTSLYNCGANEIYEINTYYVAYEKDSSLYLRNGYQKNYYPNGVLQSEGMNKNGLPTGGWKFYNDNGSLREVGNYHYGKRVGRWLAGDLSKINYLGDICMDMNNPENVALQKELESQLDIEQAFYENGDVISRNYVRVKR